MRRMFLLTLFLATAAAAQTTPCVALSGQQLIIYRAGSLTRAFAPIEKAFTCETGIQVKDNAMGSVDAGGRLPREDRPAIFTRRPIFSTSICS